MLLTNLVSMIAMQIILASLLFFELKLKPFHCQYLFYIFYVYVAYISVAVFPLLSVVPQIIVSL